MHKRQLQVESSIRGFPPIENKNAEVLILGSMPSEESLRAHQYYAHPRNAFWPIMMELLGGGNDLDYEGRAQLLIKNRIALWDTLKFCVRNGSLDSAIVDNSIEVNNFNLFFRHHKNIQHIFFNGQKSRQVYNKFVLPGLLEYFQTIESSVLPSTSPAMASLNREKKTDAWRAILGILKREKQGN